MKLLCLFLAAASLHFDITDARGKRPNGVIINTADPDTDGWRMLTVSSKRQNEPILVWPYDGKAKQPDGPESIPILIVDKADPKTASNPRVAAAVAAGALLGVKHDIGFDLSKAIAALTLSEEPWAKGVGLLAAGKPADAVAPLGRALKERERQLTRIPSEIYPAAMLYGRALFAAGKFDDAAVAYLKALKQRPSDPTARKARAEALIKAGKPEAVDDIP
jgi:tetratricopeptide (TPR) repeat protein